MNGSSLTQTLEQTYFFVDVFPVMTAFEFGFNEIDESDDLAVGFGEGSMTVEMDSETAS